MLSQKKEENINTKKWIEITEISKDSYCTKDKVFKILRIFPINYELKSELEKASIIESFNSMLRTCDFKFEIICRSIKQNISKIIKNIEENDDKNIYDTYNINLLANEYIKYLKSLIKVSKSSSKAFYIIIYTNIDENVHKNKGNSNKSIKNDENLIKEKIKLEENIKIVKEMIERCGNNVKELKNNELLEFLKTTIRQKEGEEISNWNY